MYRTILQFLLRKIANNVNIKYYCNDLKSDKRYVLVTHKAYRNDPNNDLKSDERYVLVTHKAYRNDPKFSDR